MDPERKHGETPDEIAHDPSSELGLRSPVRDKARLGDAQYNPTPPRERVSAPSDHAGAPGVCTECGATLDSRETYRADAEEYAYHFCGAGCHDRWQARNPATATDDPRRPVP